jgi:hypothetical protein
VYVCGPSGDEVGVGLGFRVERGSGYGIGFRSYLYAFCVSVIDEGLGFCSAVATGSGLCACAVWNGVLPVVDVDSRWTYGEVVVCECSLSSLLRSIRPVRSLYSSIEVLLKHSLLFYFICCIALSSHEGLLEHLLLIPFRYVELHSVLVVVTRSF